MSVSPQITFEQLAQIAGSLRRYPADGTVAALAARLRVTSDEAALLVELAVEHEVLLTASEPLTLTLKGSSLGASVVANVSAAARANQDRFRPYTDYIPKRWFP